MPNQFIVGQVEQIELPMLKTRPIMARVDTGAQTSAIWAGQVKKDNNKLLVTFFAKKCPHYNGQTIEFKNFSEVVVVNSTGHSQKRYKIKMPVIIGNRRIRASFTLSDRSKQTYPVLIGRNVLRGKFVVDISHKQTKLGHPYTKKTKEV